MSLASPQEVQQRLELIEAQMAEKQNAYESAALGWFRKKRDRDHARAVAFLKAEGSVAERNAHADVEASLIGREEEALFEALKASMRSLEGRASVGQSILRAQVRVSG